MSVTNESGGKVNSIIPFLRISITVTDFSLLFLHTENYSMLDGVTI